MVTAVLAAVCAVNGGVLEQSECRLWSAAKFEGRVLARSPQPGLYVLANHDPVTLDARHGVPLQVGGKTYRKGLYCHANSDILVVLPEPGKRFTAIVGLDQNDDTAGGRGSVIFETSVNGESRFKSGVLRFTDPAVPVDVTLGGASEFRLKIGDSGDGIGWDQSDWADAKVSLASGKSLWLSDLPLRSGEPHGSYSIVPPFSFVYGGKQVRDVLDSWKAERESKALDPNRIQRTFTYRDPETGLAVTCVAVEYGDFPTVEWTVTLRNEGAKDTPFIENLRGIDTDFTRSGGREFTLYHQNGSPAQIDDFEPFSTRLDPGSSTRVATEGGRGSSGALPYFNLNWEDEGRIVAIGWPGQWSASFVRDQNSGVQIAGGQDGTHFVLHPSEEVRTPLIALQFTGGDRIEAQNVWRRWMVAHNLPRPGGKLPTPMHVACSSHQFNEMLNANEQSQIEFIDRYAAEGLNLEYWWMDAGWYPNNGGWYNTGTWEVDRKRFPNGLRPISDHGRSKGFKTIVWFEPERVNRGTWLYEKHPEWLIGPDGDDAGHCKLLNLGNADARSWLIEHIDGLLVSEGIDLYRQDFNIAPLSIWQSADTPDRQGITENHYIAGYLAYWDELRRRHPDMLIDTCASGGRRLDLETLRRSVPLLRSDYIFEPVGQQGHTYGLSFWVPFQGTGSREIDPYLLRSVYGSSINTCWDLRRKDLDYKTARKLFAEWRSISDCFLGDYYPLTDYTLSQSQWIAWQFDLPDKATGVVQAFRRADSPYESARYKLRGLDPAARYEVVDTDRSKAVAATGRSLMEKGLLITLSKTASAAVIRYRRL